MAHNPILVEINLMMALEVLRKISEGVYTDPVFAAQVQLELNRYRLNPQGQLELKPDNTQEVNEWLRNQNLIL